jgi:hypothetical protein
MDRSLLSALGMVLLPVPAAKPSWAEPSQAGPAPSPMACETGPATRVFGGTQWIVLSCDDEASMVVIAAAGNPAMPFYFFLKPERGAYSVVGEGNGDRQASSAAFDALSRMTAADFAVLLAETRRNTR